MSYHRYMPDPYWGSVRERRHQPLTLGILPTVPEASAATLAMLGVGLVFAYLVLKPEKKR